MADVNLLEAHNVIVDAITSDVSTIENHTLFGSTAADFDSHDSLGIAFYLYACLESDYINLELKSLPDVALFWAEDKVNNGDIYPYIDKDLASIGLVSYALCKYRACPDIRERFTSLVEPHFDSNKGIFSNFLASVLVALGLRAISSQTSLLKKLEKYIDNQIKNNTHIVFNDPKNLVAAHLWAKELHLSDITNLLVRECMDRASKEDTFSRERVYYSYILLDNVNAIPRRQRHLVKEWIEESLNFIHTYSVESVFSPSSIVDEYSYDVMTKPEMMNHHGYSSRPRLSRIMLSIGLLIDRKYTLNAPDLFNTENQILRFVRGTLYPFFVLTIMAGFIYVTRKAGLPLTLKTDIESNSFWAIVKATCLKLPVDIIYASILITLLMWAYFLFHYIALKGETKDEIEATKLTFTFLRENWHIEVMLAIGVSLVIFLSGLAG